MQSGEQVWESDDEMLDLDNRPIDDEVPQHLRRLHDPHYTALRQSLEGRTSEEKASVLEIVAKYNLDPEDPMFLIMVETNQVATYVRGLEKLLEQNRLKMEAIFKQSYEQVIANLDRYEKTVIHKLEAERGAALTIFQSQLHKMVAQLIGKVTVKQALDELFRKPILWAVGLGSISIGFAAIFGAGWALSHYQTQATLRYEPGQARRLTEQQARSLSWAESPEGQYAKKIVDWNRNLLADDACLDQAKTAKVSVQVEPAGQKAKSGFCLLWVKPPNQRQFEKPAQ